jgi:uncharacterized protein (TIGR00725 family)
MAAVSGCGYVGVVGPGDATAQQLALAVDVGRALAGLGVVVVTGGLGGVMGAAARGCSEAGGTSLGLLPGGDRTAADPHLSLSVPTGLGEMRNALLVRCCDALVAVGTSWGTLSEVALAARTGVPVFLLDGPVLDDVPGGPGVVAPVRADDPEEAVALVAGSLGLEPPTPEAPGPAVLGVDGAAGGWVGALLPMTGGRVRLLRSTLVRDLVEQARALAPLEVVAIDIPIGLPDSATRQADGLARRRLAGRGSTVFPTPVRDALAATTYAEARRVSVARTGGRSLPAQSYALRRAILDVDGFVRSGPGVRVVEVHPELSFAAMAGGPLASRKKDPAGARERLAALAAHGVRLPDGVDVGTRGVDDLLDAAAAAWTGTRVVRGVADRLPEEPERFSDGIDAAIWV